MNPEPHFPIHRGHHCGVTNKPYSSKLFNQNSLAHPSQACYHICVLANLSKRNRKRAILTAIIVLTIPCYGLGVIVRLMAPDRNPVVSTSSATLTTSLTSTYTQTPSLTQTPTSTLTLTSTPTPTNTSIPTLTPSATYTFTSTWTQTSLPTNTPSATFTPTFTLTSTPSPSPTSTFTSTFTYTDTPFLPTSTETLPTP
jgi:hypothetical protein